jgi:glycine/D-amino acid oxidase-like deaminating enzyme
MPQLLIVGGGLFGAQAAAYARSKGLSATVFDPGLPRAASPAAAGLFKEVWLGRKLRAHYRSALTVLERLYEIRSVPLTHDDGTVETLLCVPPTAILERDPVRQVVTAVGDGWLEAGGARHEGYVYVAAGVWCEQFLPGLGVYGKAGSSFVFPGERPGRIHVIDHGRQAIAFVRDPGTTHFSDGTAERNYTDAHDRATLERAASLELEGPLQRFHGDRPYTPEGPVFRKIGSRTWLATGGRKMGTLLGAAFARRLVQDELPLV